MSGNIEEKDTESNDFNVKDFYDQWWTIEQLAILDTFWSYLIDSYKNQIDRWNFESIENVIKLAELYIRSRNKKLGACAQKCGIKNRIRDLKICQNQVLLQTFCREKELHLDRIYNANINFLESWAIDIKPPTPKYLWNKQIIKEIKNGIMHKKAISLPEGIYINNPKWPEHPIDFRAIIKPEFILSFFTELYFNINKYYVNRLDYWDVDFSRWFDDNVDKIYIEERVPTEEKIPVDILEPEWETRDIMQTEFLYLYGITPLTASKQLKKRKLTSGEIEQLSDFFNNHVFGEAELKFCILDKDSWYIFLIMFIGLAESHDLTYEELINNREVKQKLLGLEPMSNEDGRDYDLIADLRGKYSESNYIWLLPNYAELKGILIDLIKDIFHEDKTLLDKNQEDRRMHVLKLVNDRIGQYISEYMSNEKYYRERKKEIEMKNVENEMIQGLLDSGEVIVKNEEDVDNNEGVIWCRFKEDWSMECYCVKDEFKYYEDHKPLYMSDLEDEAIKRISSMDIGDYKEEIHDRENLSCKEKESYISMLKEDLMKIFDWAYSNINYQEVKLKMNMEWVWNYLKILGIFNYYVNDLFLLSTWNARIISNRKHIRNAFSHAGCSVLPWVNKVLFRLCKDPYISNRLDWEHIYNLQKLHKNCLKENNKHPHEKTN